MTTQTSGMSERFGDGNIAFGIKRFEDCDHNSLWRLRVSRLIGGDHCIEQDAKEAEMRLMVKFLERAIECVHTDGGRNVKDRP